MPRRRLLHVVPPLKVVPLGVWLAMVAVLGLTGCTTTPQVTADSRSTWVTEHPETPSTFVPAILDGQIMVGMSTEMVTAAWGAPTRVDVVRHDVRYDTKWVYGNYLANSAVSHLYFKDGRMEMFEFVDTKTQQSFQVTNPGDRLALQSRPPETKAGGRGSP
jgi:hypothetical protein